MAIDLFNIFPLIRCLAVTTLEVQGSKLAELLAQSLQGCRNQGLKELKLEVA